jgi:hypothetical protein
LLSQIRLASYVAMVVIDRDFGEWRENIRKEDFQMA